MRKISDIVGFVMVAVALASGSAFAATITISLNADRSSYTAFANNLEDAHSISLALDYDAAALSNPQVVTAGIAKRSDVSIQPNVTTPGRLSFTIMAGEPIKGSGPVATISFTRANAAAVPSISAGKEEFATVLTPAVTPVAAQLVINNTPSSDIQGSTTTPPLGDGSSPQGKTPGTTTTTTTAGSSNSGMNNVFAQRNLNPTYGGSGSSGGMEDIYNQAQQYRGSGGVTVTGNNPNLQDTKRDDSRRDDSRTKNYDTGSYSSSTSGSTGYASSGGSFNYSSAGDVPKTQPAVSVKDAIDQLKKYETAFQRFADYNGPRDVKKMVSLLDVKHSNKIGVFQSPEILIADGKNMLKLRIELATAAVVSNFSLRGANLKGIRPTSDTVWELDALPQKGKADVRLSVFMGSERADIPILVIPPLDPAVIKETKEFSDGGVNALLAKMAKKTEKPVYDLNNDGKQDYLDDLILVGHYLLNLQKQELSLQKQESPKKK